MRIRRRRRDYTPEQEASRKALHRAEAWLDIVSAGIASRLKVERYCTDGTRELIDFVNVELTAAVETLEKATQVHDENFPRRRLVARVRTVKAPRPKKEKPAA